MLLQTCWFFIFFLLSRLCPSIWAQYKCQFLFRVAHRRGGGAVSPWHEARTLLHGVGGHEGNQETAAQPWGAHGLWWGCQAGGVSGMGWLLWGMSKVHEPSLPHGLWTATIHCLQGQERSYNKCILEMPAARRGRSVKWMNKLPQCCPKLKGCYPLVFRKLLPSEQTIGVCFEV